MGGEKKVVGAQQTGTGSAGQKALVRGFMRLFGALGHVIDFIIYNIFS
jgi:hypothetical protein